MLLLANIPNVSKSVIVILVIVFLLYFTTILKQTPCENRLSDVFLSNFVHTDFYHLLGNVLALYGMIRVEKEMGSKRFFLLIAYLLVMNSLIEVALHKFFSVPCGIGFTGVLFGLIAFEMVSNKPVDIYLILS